MTSSSPGKPWSETRRGRAVIIAGIMGLFVLVFWLAMKARELSKDGLASQNTVALLIPPAALNIGTVWETDRFEWVLPVENRETLPIEVKSFSRSCSCLSVEPEAFTIEPGARRELRLTIDLCSQLKPTGEVSIQLMPQLRVSEGQIQAKKFPPVWKITGQVRRVLDCDRQAYLGRHSELSQPLTLRTIPLKNLVPLRTIFAECDLPGWVAAVGQGKGGEPELRLTPPLPLRAGAFRGMVILNSVLKEGEKLPSQHIRFSGEIVPDVEAVPAAVQVGGRQLGETFEDTVLLRSLTEHTFTITGSEAEGSGLTVQPIKGEQRFLVRQTACKEGTQLNRVLLQVQSGGRAVTIVVSVSYTGFESSH